MNVADVAPLRVFVSYRREDSIGMAGRIRDRLADRFGDANIFFDIDSIPLGVDYRDHIDRTVDECDVVLVVVGRRWLDAVDEHGQRRLDQPGDFVRLEVEAALRRGVPVIPLLVDGATIPAPNELPESLTDLAYRNGIPIRHDPDFHTDLDRLLRRLVLSRTSPGTTEGTGNDDTSATADRDVAATRPPGPADVMVGAIHPTSRLYRSGTIRLFCYGIPGLTSSILLIVLVQFWFADTDLDRSDVVPMTIAAICITLISASIGVSMRLRNSRHRPIHSE